MTRERFDTARIHGGYDPRRHFDAADVPIYPSTAFDLETSDRAQALTSGALTDGFTYSRVGNPTLAALEARIARLDGGIGAVAFGSGMAAVSNALLNAAEGGRIIAPDDIYGATYDALATLLPRLGVETDFVPNIADVDALEAAFRPDTKAVFVESVANPSTAVTDVAAVADIAHRHSVPLIVDNTIPTPYLYRPLEHGADIVVYSSTKGIGGHGNAVSGLVVDGGRFDWANGRFPQFTEPEPILGDEEAGIERSYAEAAGQGAFAKRLRLKYLRLLGAALGPFEAYLVLNGITTITERLDKEVASARQVAQALRDNPHVRRVLYTGLEGSGQDSLVARDFPRGVGAVLSFEVDGEEEAVRQIVAGVRVFTYLPNIGDVRSLIVNPARLTHRELPLAARARTGLTPQLIRLSIGLEDPEDLVADLEQAIAGAFA